MSKPYWEKLKDPRWQKRRLEILSNVNFVCQGCYDGEKELHVHHNLYRKGAEPWEYADHELRALCKDCHAYEEQVREDFLSRLGMIPPEYPLYLLLNAVNSILARGDEWNFSTWCMCADHSDLMNEALKRRREQLAKAPTGEPEEGGF